MRLALTIAGHTFGIDMFEPAAKPQPVADTARLDDLERKLDEQKRWAGWQANANHSGGQHAFGFNTARNETEYPHRRWEP